MAAPSRDITDQDTYFLYGRSVAEADSANVALQAALSARLWVKTLADAGVGPTLEKMGMRLSDFPRDQIATVFRPSGMDQEIDLSVLLTKQFVGKRDADERFEKATDRWRRKPDRIQGYIPADAGSFRWTMLGSELLRPFGWRDASPVESTNRVMRVIGAAWAYMAVPHFIPADVALDVVTSEPPAAEYRDEIRLPAPYVLVFHDAVPVPVVMGDDDTIDAFGEHSRVTGETVLLGGILAAGEDGRIDPGGAAFIILGKPDPTGMYGWRGFQVPYGNHPAGRVLWNYAGLLSWERWTVPPKVPGSPRGKDGSGNQIKKAARTPEAQAGGWHGVRVLDYRPPEPAPERPRGEGGGRSLRYRSERRGHFKYRVRIGIRDERGELVGPVYGPNAVEGVTFKREKRWFRRTTVRQDLPERPGAVYRVADGAARAEEF